MRGWTLGLSSGAVLLCCACGGEAPSHAGPPVDGSAPVVESLDPAWSPGSEWQVGEAVLEVGSEADPLFDVVGAVRLPGGGLAVAEGSTGTVRFFDSVGEATGRWGGAGEGPGEFRILQALGSQGTDTVWAYDFALGRVTFLHPAEGAVGIVTLDPVPSRGLARGGPAGGGWLVVQAWGDAPRGSLTEGVRRDEVAVLRYGADGRLEDTVAVLPGREILVTSEDGRAVMGPAPFGRDASVAPWGDGTVTGDQEERSLTVRGPAGGATRIVRWGGPPLEIGRGEVEAWRRWRTEGLSADEGARRLRELEGVPFPAARPAFGALLQDGTGHLWAAHHALPGRAPAAWDVLAPGGRWLGTVSMPPGFELLQAGEDWVLGVSRDSMGVETVTVRRLRRTGTP